MFWRSFYQRLLHTASWLTPRQVARIVGVEIRTREKFFAVCERENQRVVLTYGRGLDTPSNLSCSNVPNQLVFEHPVDILIGADGANSDVRSHLNVTSRQNEKFKIAKRFPKKVTGNQAA